MSDEKRDSCVQAMIDVIEEILEPEKYKARVKESQTIAPKEITLDPETMMILALLKMGMDPKELGIEEDDEE